MKQYDPKIVAPIVHINGDAKDTLVSEWLTFYDALDDLLAKIPTASFHGRNQHPKIQVDQDIARGCQDEIISNIIDMKVLADKVHNEINY